MAEHRDFEVANKFRKAVDLGWLDKDFTMYGCAYMKNQKMHYMMSTEAEVIYEYIEQAPVQGIYPSNIMTYAKKCPVPSGMEQMIAQNIKKELAYQLDAHYPKAFIYDLHQMAEKVTATSAGNLLWQEAELLSGVFRSEKLDRFRQLVYYTYSCKKIDDAQLKSLLAWITEEEKNMLDDSVSKDKYQKTLYGFAYEDNGSIKYEENAVKSFLFKKMQKFEQDGRFVTPMFFETYWYNNTAHLSIVKKEFLDKLKKELNAEYILKIKTIQNSESNISTQEFLTFLEMVKKNYTIEAYQTAKRYGHRWGVI